MLQIKEIRKQYKTGSLVQKALDGVSLNLRENEFVAILGPSGSGKTTLLNIIGGLDRYDSGDLIINGISTKKYKDRDWDSYRNHTIGFVFQSYNLIPHQTVLANVELALTISGVSKSERKRRAIRALEQVGLGEQIHKRPSQMSGGQMQRVAIARALVNDPRIVLADEPTGALDSETSIQVMELLKEVAKDRLVVMVTHNPELAEEYATRIVRLKDGVIHSDSDPYEVEAEAAAVPVHKNMGHASMSFFTALALSFNNLRTKKARTILTSFAGSIGIIGIALILSLSNGVNDYIQSIEEDTLSEYPLQIQNTGMDLGSMVGREQGTGGTPVTKPEGEIGITHRITGMLSRVQSNDLATLKAYFESGASGIEAYTKAIEYTYNTVPFIFREEGNKVRQINPDVSFAALGFSASSSSNSLMSMMMSTDVFHQLPANEDLYRSQYDIKAGRWPENEYECVVILSASGNISDFMLYAMGLRDSAELETMVKNFLAGEDVASPEDFRRYNYNELIGLKYKLVNKASLYEYDSEYEIWKDKSEDSTYMKNLVASGEDLTIVGVVQPSEDATAAMLMMGIGYMSSLTQHVMDVSAQSPIILDQLNKPTINVLTGNTFGEDNKKQFDMSSLFAIDEEAVGDSFQFDEEEFGENMDLSEEEEMFSSIDLSGININLSGVSAPDLSGLMSSLNITVNTEAVSNLASSLAEGYAAYAKENPQADYSQLGVYFRAYLQTDAARQRFGNGVRKIISEDEQLSLSAEQLQEIVLLVMDGFDEYLTENELDDPDLMSEYLAAYLQTPAAQEKLAQGAALILQMAGEVDITDEQLEYLAGEMISGYSEYAAENQLPDPSRIGEEMVNYLKTEDGQKRMNEGISQIVNMDEIQSQVASYFSGTMSSVGSEISAQISNVMSQIIAQISSQMQNVMTSLMTRIGENMSEMVSALPEAIGNAIKMNMDGNELKELMMSMMTSDDTSCDSNLKKFGYADAAKPMEIDIYPKDFASKESVLKILDDYNARMKAAEMDEKVITYTDVVGTLMSSVTEIVDTVSYVLIAFVAISLIVSSIMIGVITYISVLERKKEIGILRAIGASKGNISEVFNAETFIVGLLAGLIGIGLTLLILIPGNALIHALSGNPDINAFLPIPAAVILVALSVLLTLVGGLIPSKKASRSDPVAALRSE